MGDTIKSKQSKEKIIEIITAIFLGLTALAVAWASWISALHGGNRSINYTKSNNIAAEGNSMYTEASQQLMQDMITWNEINKARLAYSYAEEKGDEDAMEEAEYEENQLMNDNVTDDFAKAIAWADKQKDTTLTPFDMEGYQDSYFEEAQEKLDESEKLLKQGEKDTENADSFGLANVLLSVSLFLLGIVSIFKNIPNRIIILCVAIAIMLGSIIYMCTIPLPTGFNILNFFSR